MRVVFGVIIIFLFINAIITASIINNKKTWDTFCTYIGKASKENGFDPNVTVKVVLIISLAIGLPFYIYGFIKGIDLVKNEKKKGDETQEKQASK